ncbi:beta-N-acetylhexosaminidase, partial [Escherichia coli]|nr:beta-N-acetylhexosaminidase [Escherichia coli]
EGFSLIPAADEYAKHQNGEELARMGGWLMAAELIAHDIDLSFAPVLDKGHQCKAIGNRSFGEDADTILRYSTAYMQGMTSVGMATTGKHFPGHGGVIAD